MARSLLDSSAFAIILLLVLSHPVKNARREQQKCCYQGQPCLQPSCTKLRILRQFQDLHQLSSGNNLAFPANFWGVKIRDQRYLVKVISESRAVKQTFRVLHKSFVNVIQTRSSSALGASVNLEVRSNRMTVKLDTNFVNCFV
ncbi:hypothetical protein M433DRAFT_482347 [Acidomyces richmondensis BFW]|nr:MAG: hypothetical protein FE78DRAFT_310764 [Acidomyces sp. 'richmondensis']KYG50257.1 hypothetical protein M433DRAFT_482347 [Acidomyces richmondensis BFW]